MIELYVQDNPELYSTDRAQEIITGAQAIEADSIGVSSEVARKMLGTGAEQFFQLVGRDPRYIELAMVAAARNVDGIANQNNSF